ncbi:unnamed protein product [Caenorhabditis nigoni]
MRNEVSSADGSKNKCDQTRNLNNNSTQNLIDYLNARIGCDEEINQKSIVRLACEVLSINFQIRCPWHTGFANYLYRLKSQ